MRTLYAAEAADYDRRWACYTYSTRAAALDHVQGTGAERVLDLACGTGELSRQLLAQWPGLTVVGLDLSEEMLTRAATKLRGNRRAALVLAGAGRVPFADGSFDLVVCTNAFHYFREPGRVCGEMHRVLRAGGRALIVDWCHDYWTCKLCQWYLRLADPAHFRMYGLRECDAHRGEAGFVGRERQRFKISLLWGLMVLGGAKPAAGG